MIEKRNKYDNEGIEKTTEKIVLKVLGHRYGYIKGLVYGPKSPSKGNSLIELVTYKFQKELTAAQEKLNKSETENEVNELRNQLNNVTNQLTN